MREENEETKKDRLVCDACGRKTEWYDIQDPIPESFRGWRSVNDARNLEAQKHFCPSCPLEMEAVELHDPGPVKELERQIETLKADLREASVDVETLLRDRESEMGDGLVLQYRTRLDRYKDSAGPPPRNEVVERPCLGEKE